MDLGVKKENVNSTVADLANPHLVKFAETLLEKVSDGDFVAGVVGQNIILEGMAFSVFELLQASAAGNPKFAKTLAGTIADERRHVGFGENRIGSLIREHPEKKAEVQAMQAEMSYHMLATFTDMFSDAGQRMEEAKQLVADSENNPLEGVTWHGADLMSATPDVMEAVLADTVLNEFRTRLDRIGIEYQSPKVPARA